MVASMFVASVCIAMCSLWGYFHFLHREHWIDRTRQRLFRIRDELFDRAAAGEVNFNDDAYRLTRTTLNGMIRYAHELSVLDIVLSAYALRRTGYDLDELRDRYRGENDRALRRLPLAQRRLIVHAQQKMHVVALSHIVHTNLLLWWLVPVGLIGRVAFGIARALRGSGAYSAKAFLATRYRRSFSRLDAFAHEIGNERPGSPTANGRLAGGV